MDTKTNKQKKNTKKLAIARGAAELCCPLHDDIS